MEQLLQQLNQYWQPVIEYFAFDTALLTEPDMIFRLVLMLCLLVCSAFFSSSETALFSLSRLDLQQLRKEQNQHSETIHELLDQPRKLIISILCGNELVNIAAAANMTSILVTLYPIDRVVMILAGTENIREVIMFPMNQRAEDLMMGAPSEPTGEQLRELRLRVLPPED